MLGPGEFWWIHPYIYHLYIESGRKKREKDASGNTKKSKKNDEKYFFQENKRASKCIQLNLLLHKNICLI